MERKHLTVVYTINDPAAFEAERDRLIESFQTSDGKPWAVTAMSIDHEILRVDLLSQAIERRDIDLCEHIIGHTDLSNVNTIDDLEE